MSDFCLFIGELFCSRLTVLCQRKLAAPVKKRCQKILPDRKWGLSPEELAAQPR